MWFPQWAIQRWRLAERTRSHNTNGNDDEPDRHNKRLPRLPNGAAKTSSAAAVAGKPDARSKCEAGKLELGQSNTGGTSDTGGRFESSTFDALPRAVVARVQGRRRVRFCSAAARALGVRPGMPLAEARAVAPSLLITEDDPAADRAELVRWAAWCEQFSPLVGIASPDDESLLLDISGLEHLFGSERALAEQLAEGLRRQGLYAQLAIADTVGAAFAAAHQRSPHRKATTERTSRAAPGRATQGGESLPTAILPPGDTTALKALSIFGLRLSDEAVSLLLQLGIERIGALAALPRCEVSRRLGAEVVLRLQQALGRRPEPIEACRPAKIPRACWDAEDRWLTTRDEVVTVCEQLLRPLAEQLARSGRGALRMFCRLECVGAGQGDEDAPARPGMSLAVGLFAPSASAAQWLGLLSLQCERLSLPGPVARVEVSIPLTAPLVSYQAVLWGERTTEDVPRGGAALIERLCSRLGGRAVCGVQLTKEPLPEAGWRAAALTARRGEHAACTSNAVALRRAVPSRSIPPRPLALFRAPQPVDHVVCGPDGLPRCFRYGRRWRTIVALAGPERIVTGWWRGRTTARDYYRVQTSAGGRYWLFRSRDCRWYLHGRFD